MPFTDEQRERFELRTRGLMRWLCERICQRLAPHPQERIDMSENEIKDIKIGGVFRHPELGMVRYVRPDREYGLICELELVDGSDVWFIFTSWSDLYKLGFNLEI